MNDAEFQRLTKSLLFIDIETVSGQASFHDLPERLRYQWQRKATYLRNGDPCTDEELYFRRGGVYAEFGKVVVIGLGFLFQDEDGTWSLKVRSLANDCETTLLREFIRLVEKYDANRLALCAHNGKEFDFPYLCRRMLINGLTIPRALDYPGRKPWEVPHLDTLDLWKFGDKKHYTSLELLAAVFDIPTSKGELSGDEVNPTYHLEGDLPKIARYCREDVVVLAQLFLRYQNRPLVAEDCIVRVD
jgi:DNA polymerase elongation subunit (family B)